MTLIVAHSGLIIADSSRDRGAEAFREAFREQMGLKRQSEGKIFAYATPVEVRATIEDESVSEVIYGFAGTGKDDIIQAIGERVGQFGLMDAVLTAIKEADTLRLVGHYDSTTIAFFGYDGLFELHIETGAVRVFHKKYSRMFCYTLGSGSGAYQRVMQEYNNVICPVVAMYATFAMEPTLGGDVEVWPMPRTPKDKFVKLETQPAISLPDVFKLVGQNPKPLFSKEQLKWIRHRTSVLQKTSTKPSAAKTPAKSPSSPASRKGRSKASAPVKVPRASKS